MYPQALLMTLAAEWRRVNHFFSTNGSKRRMLAPAGQCAWHFFCNRSIDFTNKNRYIYNASGRSRQASPRAIQSIASPVAFFIYGVG